MLKIAIDITVASDWKSISILNTTGSSITGYGTNQDPVGYRRASGSGTDIVSTVITLTSPSNTSYTFTLNAAQSYAATLSPYIIYNTDLGYAASSLIEAGVWKVSYTNYFANGVTVSVVNGSPTVTYPSSDESFTGISYLKTNTGGTPVYYAVSAINPVTNTFTLTANYASTTNATYSAYNVGYEAIECFVIADSIKNCLDGKVAALPGSNCPCKEQQMQKLIFNYMLYDAMLINAANNNQVKAQYIYDILSNYCSESDCNCNG